MARYSPQNAGHAEDGRLFSAVFPRNNPPLIAALAPWLGARPGRVLELGCGTGQHAAAFELAFTDLEWVASDPDPLHRASAEAWRAYLRLPPRPALDVDASVDWAAGLTKLAPFDAVFSANVIHIAPVAVMHGILRGAAGVLGHGGLLIFYGPFMEHGAHTGPGNAAFDDNLRSTNPEWGLRDVADIDRQAADVALTPVAARLMPANNRLLIYRRSGPARVEDAPS